MPLHKKSPRKSPKKSPRLSPRVRKGPADSAKNHAVGTIKRGLDKHRWQIILVNKKDGTQYKRWKRL